MTIRNFNPFRTKPTCFCHLLAQPFSQPLYSKIYYLFRMSDFEGQAGIHQDQQRTFLNLDYKPSCLLSNQLDLSGSKQEFYGRYEGDIPTRYMKYINDTSKNRSNQENRLLSLDLLPGNAPIYDHLLSLLNRQPTNQGGGSFLPFLDRTLTKIHDYLHIKNTSHPFVRSIVFGQSSERDASTFRKTLAEAINVNNRRETGWLPYSMVACHASYVVGSKPLSFFKTISPKGYTCPLRPIDNKMVSRLSITLHGLRWDIIFPWEEDNGAFTISSPESLPEFWLNFFGSLPGVFTGLDLETDLIHLTNTVSMVYCIHSDNHHLGLKIADLTSMLTIAGVNLTSLSIPAISFLFSGVVTVCPKELLSARFSDTNGLPIHLNLFLQSVGECILNAMLLSQICFLIHLCPTPGIAGLVSKKVPITFLTWFSEFIHCFLQRVHLPKGVVTGLDNAEDKLALIIKRKNLTSLLSTQELLELLPPHPSITEGGCPIDSLAISHLIERVHPIMTKKGFPPRLKWFSKIKVLTGLFESPATPPNLPAPGCVNDPSRLTTPPFDQDKFSFAVRKVKANPDFARLTKSQILLRLLWDHPNEAETTYQKSLDNPSFNAFSGTNIDLALPVICGFSGKTLERPNSDKRLRAEKSARQQCMKVIDLTHGVNKGHLKKGIALSAFKKLAKKNKNNLENFFNTLCSMAKRAVGTAPTTASSTPPSRTAPSTASSTPPSAAISSAPSAAPGSCPTVNPSVASSIASMAMSFDDIDLSLLYNPGSPTEGSDLETDPDLEISTPSGDPEHLMNIL